jgi:2-C-methyl-D-erythritol 4-phosphate cytidylyltransferase
MNAMHADPLPGKARYWVIIPAAGYGRRMGMAQPKQFLYLEQRTVLEHTLEIFLRHPQMERVVLVLPPTPLDHAVPAEEAWRIPHPLDQDSRLLPVPGGAERMDSVRHGLAALAPWAQAQDWVLVHDAARPCLSVADLERLLEALAEDPVGGLLAAVSTDTLKWADATQRVTRTLERERVWRALTPQMFRYALLQAALDRAAQAGVPLTDEASAVEALGHHPRLIEGSPMNIKITRPEDLVLARFLLQQQNRL